MKTSGTDEDPAGVILIVEDEPQMRVFLRAALVTHGFDVVEAGSVAEGLRWLSARPPTLVLLDLGLPDGDGRTLLCALRAWSSILVIVLSARAGEHDRVEVLDDGADDYLTKPFGVAELLARIRVALRHAGAGRDAPVDAILTVGPIRIDQARHQVEVSGTLVHLTPLEFRLLAVLARHAGRMITQRQLLLEVWGPAAAQQTHYLRVHMGALRRKIEKDPARPQWLITESGVGYRLRDEAIPATK